MNYIQGLPSPDFSLLCFFNCKTRWLEVITTKIPSNMDTEFNGFIFYKVISHCSLSWIILTSNRIGLCSFAKTLWTSQPSCSFVHEILILKFLFLFRVMLIVSQSLLKSPFFKQALTSQKQLLFPFPRLPNMWFVPLEADFPVTAVL